ncbi:MAG: hypothetical protein JXL80_05665 [Planctomycetes bacterium]|nr:hypothetical protein [Planctomycetota bacterium]
MDVLGLAGGLVAGLKKLSELAKKLHNAELHDLVANLTLQGAELKMKLAELQSENSDLRSRVDDLARKADIRSKVESRDGLYYLTQRIEGYGKGPFCPTCLDQDGQLISLQKVFRNSWSSSQGATKAHAGWRCGRCGNKCSQ